MSSFLEKFLADVQTMVDWLPIYSEGSAGYDRRKKVEDSLARIRAAQKFWDPIIADAVLVAERGMSTNGQLSLVSSTSPKVTRSQVPPQKRDWDHVCPTCSHVHIGVSVCGVDMGGAGSCDCRIGAQA